MGVTPTPAKGSVRVIMRRITPIPDPSPIRQRKGGSLFRASAHPGRMGEGGVVDYR